MVIGRGTAGFTDGDFFSAEFNHPQGMALDGEVLYVADTENHAVRKVDLARQTVETLAGTGKQARAFNVAGRGKAAALNSPWDLVFHQGVLYVAMAGFHQLWALDPRTGEARPYVGSGREGRVDGLLRSAALAQPSGIATDGRKLYFADSEASAIRTADLNSQGHVETLVGLGLFEFGDRDGTGEKVRLQHPLGVACHDGVLYVADTYNNKIKRLDPTTGTCSTFLGQGSAGYRDGSDPLFHEPGGLSVAGGQLYIADTNNHALRVADLTTREVTTLTLKQPSP
jgi:sugar lactone lactonase YvrE